jgi:hypothetical protein
MTEKKTRSEKPVIKAVSRGSPKTGDQRLTAIVDALQRQPGVRVLSVASEPPRGPNPHGVAHARAVLVRYDRLGQAGGKAEFDTYSDLTSGPYATGFYHGSNRFFREYRKNFLVSGCLDLLGYWSTKEGFDTVLEPRGVKFTEDDVGKAAKAAYLEKYAGLKEYIDQQNENVSLDDMLPVGVIMTKIFGHHGFEYDDDGTDFTRWVSLDPDQIQPVNNRRKQRMGYSYKGKGTTVADPFYQPEDVFYLCNKDLDGLGFGLSDIEPILKEIQLDDKIVREDLTEAATTLWAGQILLWLDIDRIPAGWTDAQIQAALNAQVAAMAPGKTVASDNRWTAQIVDLKPDTDKLVNISDKMQYRILGNFKTPRYMLSLQMDSWARATAFAELETYIDGPVTACQKWLKRALEHQWYAKLESLWLAQNDPGWSEGDPFPVTIKHEWRQIRTADWFQLVTTVAAAYDSGNGFADQQKCFEMMARGQATHFDPKELEVKQLAMTSAIKQFPQKQIQVAPDGTSPSAP